MKPLYRSVVAGVLIACVHFLILQSTGGLWNINFISLSGLIAGIFFIMAMIFRSALQDYKNADIAISKVRAKFLSMQDTNSVAAINANGKYDSKAFNQLLIETIRNLKKYINNDISFLDSQKTLDELNSESLEMRSYLSVPQENNFLRYQWDLREAISYIAFAKDLKFSKAGYVFLYFYISILIGLQIFASAESVALGLLYIFSLSSVLLFFAELIRDMDHPFDRKLNSFCVDTVPLENAIKALESAEQNKKNH